MVNKDEKLKLIVSYDSLITCLLLQRKFGKILILLTVYSLA